MWKSRNLMAIGIALIMLAAFMIPLTFAEPAQQATATPESTTAATQTPGATAAATVVSPIATPEVTATPLVTATTVSPTATAIGTPGTLPTTGGRDSGSAVLGLIVIVIGALIVVGAVALRMSRRTS